MTVYFCVHDASGRLLRTGICPEAALELQAQAGEFVLEVDADLLADYIRDGQVLPRPDNPVRLSGSTLVNVPVPAVVTINDVAYPSNESTVELAFTYPGSYRVRVEAFPYQDAAFTVTL